MACLSRPYQIKFFKGCLPQTSLVPFLNTLSQIFLRYTIEVVYFTMKLRILELRGFYVIITLESLCVSATHI